MLLQTVHEGIPHLSLVYSMCVMYVYSLCLHVRTVTSLLDLQDCGCQLKSSMQVIQLGAWQIGRAYLS